MTRMSGGKSASRERDKDSSKSSAQPYRPTISPRRDFLCSQPLPAPRPVPICRLQLGAQSSHSFPNVVSARMEEPLVTARALAILVYALPDGSLALRNVLLRALLGKIAAEAWRAKKGEWSSSNPRNAAPRGRAARVLDEEAIG
eukprot:684367-Prymnesium_polylepis.1